MAASSPALGLHSRGAARFGMGGFLIALGDVCAVTVALTVAVVGRYALWGDFELSFYLRLSPALLLFPVVYAMHGLYPGVTFSPVREIRQLTLSTTLTFTIMIVLAFLFKEGDLFSRAAFLGAWFLALFLAPLTRTFLRAAWGDRTWWGYPVVILGGSQASHRIIQDLQRRPRMGLMPVAAFADGQASALSGALSGPSLPVMGDLNDAARYAERFGFTRALIAMPDLGGDRLAKMLDFHEKAFSRFYIFLEMSGVSCSGIEPREMCNQLTFEVRQNLLLPECRLAKAILDLSLGLVLSLLLLPLMCLICILIRLESRGAALFAHRRIGCGGREFMMWKFRSMYRDGDRILEEHFRKHPEARLEWDLNHKLRRDPRVTPLGRILRKTSLDELPQLWNVLRGEMSIVGPRPIVQAEISKYGRWFSMYTRVCPGLTGLWQVSGRSETDYQQRVDLDAYYVRNWSPWFDLYLLARTVLVVIKGEGAY